jgi:hypothetical protein
LHFSHVVGLRKSFMQWLLEDRWALEADFHCLSQRRGPDITTQAARPCRESGGTNRRIRRDQARMRAMREVPLDYDCSTMLGILQGATTSSPITIDE